MSRLSTVACLCPRLRRIFCGGVVGRRVMVGKRQAHMKGEKKSQMRGKFAFVVGPVRPPIHPLYRSRIMFPLQEFTTEQPYFKSVLYSTYSSLPICLPKTLDKTALNCKSRVSLPSLIQSHVTRNG